MSEQRIEQPSPEEIHSALSAMDDNQKRVVNWMCAAKAEVVTANLRERVERLEAALRNTAYTNNRGGPEFYCWGGTSNETMPPRGVQCVHPYCAAARAALAASTTEEK